MKRLTIAVYASFVLISLGSCLRISSKANAILQPSPLPDFTWDTNPNTRVMLATFCCDSPTTEELVRFYVPEAQLWGDGRYRLILHVPGVSWVEP